MLIIDAETFRFRHHEAVSELMSRARALTLDPSDYARLAGLDGAFDDGIPGRRGRSPSSASGRGRSCTWPLTAISAGTPLGSPGP